MQPQQSDGISFTPASSPPTSGQSDGINFQQTMKDNSSAQMALSHSNGLMMNLMKTAGQGALDLGTGAVKAGLHTGMELGHSAAWAGSQLPGQAGQFFQDKLQAGDQAMQAPVLQQHGMMQNIGAGAEHVAEFMAPAGLEKGIATAVAPMADKVAPALGLGGKLASYLSGALKTGTRAITSGLSMAGITGAQTGGDVNAMKQAGTLGGIAGGASGALETLAPGWLQSIEKSGFKLSPMQQSKASKVADNAASFMANNKIVGTEESQFKSLQGITSNMENALQSSLPNAQISTKNVVDEINSTVEQLQKSDPAIYKQARNVANDAIQAAQAHGDAMSIQDALNAKRSWGEMAFKMAAKGKTDPLVSNEGAFSAEQAFQKSIEGAMTDTGSAIQIPENLQSLFGGAKQTTLPEFNKVYSDAINSKNLMGIARFKSDAHLFGRIFGLWAGRSLGAAAGLGPIGEIMAAGGGEALSNKLPGMARWTGEKILTNTNAPATAAKIGQGITNSLSGQAQ